MKSNNKLFTCGGISLLLTITLLCLTFSLFAQFYGLDGPSHQSGQIRAIPIISALDEYKNNTGKYPTDLSILIPTYLPSTPRPAWRWPYVYEYEARENGDGFILLFAVGRNMDGDYCGYSSQTKKWECADSTRPY